MTPGNFERALQAFTHRKPFKTFLVELVSGERIQVRHPEAIRLEDGIAVFLASTRKFRLFDGESVSQVFDEPDQAQA
jgi:hypothetical protein